MLRLTAFAVAIALLCACSRAREQKWPERSARVSCKTARRCDTANFWFHYDSLGACIEDTMATSEGSTEGCLYDKKASRRCIHDMKWSCKAIGVRYDELLADCAAVWTCPVEDTGTDTGALLPF